jgi:acetyl-CoA carboxylase biotin carboxyl carrier protein
MLDSETGSEDVFEVDRIRNLVELMKEFDLREIDLRQSNQRIRLCRGRDEAPAPAVTVAPSVAAAPPPLPAAAASAAPPPAPEAPRSEPEAEHITYITSPMVGTFYARPNPNAERCVSVGDHVDADTTVCIIEAMKVFNEIPAEVRGRIVAVLAEDEEPVEFGKPLFKVDTSA